MFLCHKAQSQEWLPNLDRELEENTRRVEQYKPKREAFINKKDMKTSQKISKMENSKHQNQIAHEKQDSHDHIQNHILYGFVKEPKSG